MKSVSKLTFYGGVDEIGGNKVLLEDKGTRILLDFGESFSCGVDYFAGWLQPRSVTGLKDYFEFDLLPKLKGVYAKEHLRHTSLRYTEPKIDAVFLSHAHFDHVNHIRFLDPKIPVYLGVGAKLFLEAMEQTSTSSEYGEHCYRTFRSGDTVKIGSLAVEPIHVDHSIPAAYSFIIHTSAGAIVYTGDFRSHGPRKDLTTDFLEKARSCEPVALISEGTRVVDNDTRGNLSEENVRERADALVSKTRKPVFLTHYSRDMDRLRTLYQVAKENNRQLVISPKTAHLLQGLLQDEHLKLPDPVKDDTLLIYFRKKRSGTFQDTDYFLWEREFMDKMVNHEYVNRKQRELMMNLSFYNLTELIDIRPITGSHFIHSMSEPFSEEDVEDQVMQNWLDHFGIEFHQLHSSGHLNKGQLAKFLNEIRAKKVFPIHTENQHLFKSIAKNVQIVERATEYKLQ